jgi:hypothetical protein
MAVEYMWTNLVQVRHKPEKSARIRNAAAHRQVKQRNFFYF